MDDAHKPDILRLWAEGMSGKAIGEKFGYTRSAIIGFVHRSGYARPAKTTQKQRRLTSTKRREPYVPAKTIDDSHTPVLQIMDLENRHCRWPYGARAPFLYCGGHANLIEDMPYCSHHASMAYAKPKPPIRAPFIFSKARR